MAFVFLKSHLFDAHIHTGKRAGSPLLVYSPEASLARPRPGREHGIQFRPPVWVVGPPAITPGSLDHWQSQIPNPAVPVRAVGAPPSTGSPAVPSAQPCPVGSEECPAVLPTARWGVKVEVKAVLYFWHCLVPCGVPPCPLSSKPGVWGECHPLLPQGPCCHSAGQHGPGQPSGRSRGAGLCA